MSMNLKTIFMTQVIITLILSFSWAINLYRFTQCDFKPSYKTEIIYGIGIFTPIAVITVWIDFEK